MSQWFDAESYADRALEMYERGRWAEAEAELRKAIALNPDQGEWYFNLGLTLEQSGRDEEALASYRRATELMSEEPEPLVAVGVVCNRLQRFEEAVQVFEQAESLNPNLEGVYAHRIDSYICLGRHDDAEMVYYLSQQALEEPSAACLSAIAESLILRREFERAGWCLREALRLAPNMPRIRARLGTVLAAMHQPRRAVQLYLRDLRDDPGNIDTLLDYGDLLMSLGRLSEAGEKFRRVLEMEPANIEAHHRLGQIALASGRIEQAQIEFELVHKLHPQFPGIHLFLAETLLRRGRQDEARIHLQHERDATTTDDRPEVFPPLEQLSRFGGLLLEAGMASDAAQVFEQALAGDEDSPELLRQLALARFQSNDRDGGVVASRRALRLDPHCVASMHNLALAALKEGRLRTASGWIRQGLKVNRHDNGLRRLRMRLWLSAVGMISRRLLKEMKARLQRKKTETAKQG